MRASWHLVRDAALQWSAHNAPRLGAALAYYAVLSLAPLLILVVEVCGYFFGEQDVRGQVYWEISQTVGSQSAAVIESLLTGIHQGNSISAASIFGIAILLLGASGVFVELRDALNYIWDAPPGTGSGFYGFLRDRIFSFAMVVSVGFLLAFSLAATTLVRAVGAQTSLHVSPAVLDAGDFFLSFAVKAFLFGLIYRVIPHVHVDWREVAIGAVITAALFETGTFLITFYLQRTQTGSAYGAAGSLVALLVWVYYSAQIFLYGAELTHVYAKSRRAVSSVPRPSSAPPAFGRTPHR
ncbi:MAG TPA: YihY/virulence factor BrkB family protein [Bryobacteraceae bacterium]|nr:YihY/virulence factor BrkB family protein [Bryobacteraceae bacterium]